MQSERTQQESDEGIVQEYRRRRTRGLVISILVVLAIMCIGYWPDSGPRASITARNVLSLIAMTMLCAGAVAYSLFNWRCPACNKWFGGISRPVSRGKHKVCPKCGVRLR